MAASGTPWFRVYSQLPRHPKVTALASALKKSKVQVVGHLVHLWCWVNDFAPDGDLSDFDAQAIAKGASWRGEPEVFLEAIVTTGWVNCDLTSTEPRPNRDLTSTEPRPNLDLTSTKVHNWKRYAETYRRAQGKRTRRTQQKKVGIPKNSEDGSPDSPPTTVRQSPDSPPERRGEERRGEEKRGEEIAPPHGVARISLPIGPLSDALGTKGSEVEEVKAHYLKTYPERTAASNGAEALIVTRLRNHSVPDLCRAIDGALRKDSWYHREGQTDLRLLMRSDGKVDELLALADKPIPAKRVSYEESLRQAGREWAEEED